VTDDIRAIIRLEASKGNEEVEWFHPVLLSNAHEDFRFPGDNSNNYLDKLASNYDYLVVVLEWRNSFNRRQSSHYRIDLKKQLDGWTKAKFLLQPDDIPVQLGKIKGELTKISNYFQKQENRQVFKELEEQANQAKKKSPKTKKSRKQ
jgi:hypothetical protein